PAPTGREPRSIPWWQTTSIKHPRKQPATPGGEEEVHGRALVVFRRGMCTLGHPCVYSWTPTVSHSRRPSRTSAPGDAPGHPRRLARPRQVVAALLSGKVGTTSFCRKRRGSLNLG